MGFFSSGTRRKSKQARINALKRKIARRAKKISQQKELESLQKKWAKG